MKTLYVVVGGSGKFEDYSQWTVRAFSTHEKADAHRALLNHWLMDNKIPLAASSVLTFDLDNVNEALKASGLDTQASGVRLDGCGIFYHVEPM